MYTRVAPGVGGRGARHPGELLEGTSEDVVVVGGVVVGVAAETELDTKGTSCPTASKLSEARAESVSNRRRQGRARLSRSAVITPVPWWARHGVISGMVPVDMGRERAAGT
jgi:hypothetical protein